MANTEDAALHTGVKALCWRHMQRETSFPTEEILTPGHLEHGEVPDTEDLLKALKYSANDARELGRVLMDKISIDRGIASEDNLLQCASHLRHIGGELACSDLPLFESYTKYDYKTDRLIIQEADTYSATVSESLQEASDRHVVIWDALLWIVRCLEIGTTYADRLSWDAIFQLSYLPVPYILLNAYNTFWLVKKGPDFNTVWEGLMRVCEREHKNQYQQQQQYLTAHAYETVFGGLARTSWTQAMCVISCDYLSFTVTEAHRRSLFGDDGMSSSGPISYVDYVELLNARWKDRFRCLTEESEDCFCNRPTCKKKLHRSVVVCDRLPLTFVVASSFTFDSLPGHYWKEPALSLRYMKIKHKKGKKQSPFRRATTSYRLVGVVVRMEDNSFACRYARPALSTPDDVTTRREYCYNFAKDNSLSANSTDKRKDSSGETVVLCFYEAMDVAASVAPQTSQGSR